MERRQFLKWCAISAGGILLPGEVLAGPQAKVTDVRLWTAPDSTRVVFELDRPTQHTLFRLKNPDRLVLDIQNAQFHAKTNGIGAPDPVVERVRAGSPKEGVVRVVFDLKMEIKPRSFALDATENKGFRLVVDLFRQSEEAAATSSEEKPAPRASKERKGLKGVVVLDPGHGGEDPGAVGARGTYEKHIAFAVATRLQSLFHNEGYKAYLTRKGDYYVPLRKRVAIGRQFEPDIFISLHADAFHERSARGASVFCLSERGKPSPDNAIEALVKRENDADLIGGVDLTQVADREVATILMDLSQRESINRAMTLGGILLSTMQGITSLKYRSVQQAGFAVLKAPDIPSVLVEMAFLSNPFEEELLKNEAHQKKIASALFDGTRSFFQKVGKT